MWFGCLFTFLNSCRQSCPKAYSTLHSSWFGSFLISWNEIGSSSFCWIWCVFHIKPLKSLLIFCKHHWFFCCWRFFLDIIIPRTWGLKLSFKWTLWFIRNACGKFSIVILFALELKGHLFSKRMSWCCNFFPQILFIFLKHMSISICLSRLPILPLIFNRLMSFWFYFWRMRNSWTLVWRSMNNISVFFLICGSDIKILCHFLFNWCRCWLYF